MNDITSRIRTVTKAHSQRGVRGTSQKRGGETFPMAHPIFEYPFTQSKIDMYVFKCLINAMKRNTNATVL